MSNRENEPMGKSQDREQSRGRVKVLLVDDHTMFREGLAGILSSSSYGEEEVEVVGKSPLGEEAVKVAREENPDVILMQVDRTLNKAKKTLERIRQVSSSPPKVIILTMFEDARILREVLKLGVEAYVHKSASVEELIDLLRPATTTLDGQREPMIVSLPQGKLELAEDGSGEDGSVRMPSKREMEILLLAARGLSNHQIASQLHISENTVKRHLANLYPKLGWSQGEKRCGWPLRMNGSPSVRSKRP